MRFASACVAVLIAACNSSGNGAETSQSMPNENDQGLVYYYEFGIERIAGLHESEIEEYGCHFTISRHDFEESLLAGTKVAMKLKYNKLDVRAKVQFPSEEPYFIDRFGAVSRDHGSVLDKEQFVNHLGPIGKC